ncbi:hypothetical protein GCM10009735_72090 [Actinomadura chokoriensis]
MALLTFAAGNPAFRDGLEPGERGAVQRLLDRRGTTATAGDRHFVLSENYLVRRAVLTGRGAPRERRVSVRRGS